MAKSSRFFTSVVLSLGLAACLPGMGQQPASSSPPPSSAGKASPEAIAKVVEIANNNATQCEQKTDDTTKKFAAAVDKMAGGQPDASGKPAASMTTAVGTLRKQNVTVTIDVLGSPEMPLLMMKDSVMAEGAKLQGAPQAKLQAYAKKSMAAQPALTPLRDTVMAVNTTLGAAFQSTMSCNGFAQGMTTQLGAMENGDNEIPPELFTAYKRVIQANARSKTIVAASIAMVGVIQAGLAGKDPKAVDTLIDGMKKTEASPEEITDDQAKAAYHAAGQGLFDACHEQMEKAYKDHPEMQRPAVDPCSKEGSRVKGSPSEEAARADAANAGSGGGGGDLTDDVVKRLVPRNTPLADASDALLAVKNGDFLGALKSAAKLAGRVSPLGGALSSVLSMF